MPGARCTRRLAGKKVTTPASVVRYTGSTLHSLRNGVNGSSVVALVYRAF
jgi:hypothetical protein